MYKKISLPVLIIGIWFIILTGLMIMHAKYLENQEERFNYPDEHVMWTTDKVDG
jgi:hypothetical protein